MARFEDALVVVTGVGREGQVGDAVAHAFAADGAGLALIGRDAAEVRERAAALAATGAQVTAHACDLADRGQAEAVAREVAARAATRRGAAVGRIDALVTIAGGFALSGPIADADLAGLSSQLTMNLTTAYVASSVFFPLVRDGGSIVYFASANALPQAPSARMSAYVAAKAAVIGLMQSVADEGKPRGVRANAVAPISIRTADNLRAMGASARYVDREAVAAAVLFLCSDAARGITGQVIRLTD